LHVPNSRIYTPFDEESLVRSLREALECDVPCFVRYPKAVLTQVELENHGSFVYAGFGQDVTLVAYGPMVIQAADALNHLKNYGIMGEVFGLWQVRPLPMDYGASSGEKKHLCSGGRY